MRATIIILTICLMFSCKNKYIDQDDSQIIQIKWNKAYEEDSIDKAVIGLQWALSYLGANSPCKTNTTTIRNNIITLHTLNLGFNTTAKSTFEKLLNEIKKTEKYRKTKTIDLGRFITLLLGSPEHYYKLIGTAETLDKLKSNYILNSNKGYVNNSSVGLQDRVLSFSDRKDLNQLWISEEIDSITKTIYEFETIELLKNGQLRFGIYDDKGFRKNVANKKHTRAGKPAKCIWCHESNLNQLFREQDDFYGFLSSEELQQKIIASRDTFNTERAQLKDNIDYSKKQQHTYTELLYISFLEPSLNRLSIEWQIEASELKTILKDIETHTHKEFPFLGDLYHRREIDVFSPLKSIEVSGNVRELTKQEVNYLVSDK